MFPLFTNFVGISKKPNIVYQRACFFVFVMLISSSLKADLTKKTKLLVQITAEPGEQFDDAKFCELIVRTMLIRENVLNVGLFSSATCSKDDLKSEFTTDTFVLNLNVTNDSYIASYRIASHTETFEVSEPNIGHLLFDENYVKDLAFYLLNTMPYQGYSESASEAHFVKYNKHKFSLQTAKIRWDEKDEIFLVSSNPYIIGGRGITIISYKNNKKILSHYRQKLSDGHRYERYKFIKSNYRTKSLLIFNAAYMTSLSNSKTVLSETSLMHASVSWLSKHSLYADLTANIWPRVKNSNSRFSAQDYIVSLGTRLNLNRFDLSANIVLSREVIDLKIENNNTIMPSDFDSVSVNNSGLNMGIRYSSSIIVLTTDASIRGLLEKDNSNSFLSKNIELTAAFPFKFSRQRSIFGLKYYYENKTLKEDQQTKLSKFTFDRNYLGIYLGIIY